MDTGEEVAMKILAIILFSLAAVTVVVQPAAAQGCGSGRVCGNVCCP
jgi:hypothetical protein